MFSTQSVTILVTILTKLVAAASNRETVNFDFAWRHFLGSPTGNYSRVCTAGTKGINYGLGGRRYGNVDTPEACCAKCAEQPSCGCWDLNIQVTNIYNRFNSVVATLIRARAVCVSRRISCTEQLFSYTHNIGAQMQPKNRP